MLSLRVVLAVCSALTVRAAGVWTNLSLIAPFQAVPNYQRPQFNNDAGCATWLIQFCIIVLFF